MSELRSPRGTGDDLWNDLFEDPPKTVGPVRACDVTVFWGDVDDRFAGVAQV